MHRSSSYHLLVKVTALMLWIGVALPTGLQAKQFIDYCFMPVEESTDMKHDHSCCLSDSDEQEPDDTTKHDCNWGFICACNIDRSLLSDQNWTMPNTLFAGDLVAISTIEPELHTDFQDQSASPNDTYSTPPIFLLNSTFLN